MSNVHFPLLIQSSTDQIKSTTTTPISKPVTVDIPITILPEHTSQSVVSHKSESISSASHVSAVKESHISQSTTKFTLEHSTPPVPSPKPWEPIKPVEQFKPIEIPVLIEKELPKPTQEYTSSTESKTIVYETKEIPQQQEVKTEETGIETSSISKQSSLDFFVSKMKESEEPVKPKLVETQKIPSEIYTKFKEISTPAMPEFKPEPVVTHDIKTEVETKLEKDAQFFTSSSSQEYKHFTNSQSQLFEEFNLTPEPPPEIGFIPKTETVQKREDVTVKIKRLEDSHRDLSPLEVPSGAVRIFPTVPSKPKEEVIEKRHEVKEEICVKKHVERKDHPDFDQPCVSSPDTKYWAPVSFTPEPVVKKEDSLPVFRPQAPAATRPLSPRPSAEAVEMEKLWTPTVPSAPEIPIPQPVRAPSPKPSPQGIAMEKLWTQKTVDSSYSTMDKSYTKVSQTTSSVEPSAEGKTMEKMWAHKHSDSHLKTLWPPQQVEEKPVQKVILPTVEKQWVPVETKSESIIKESSSFSKSQEIRSVTAPVPVIVPKPAPIMAPVASPIPAPVITPVPPPKPAPIITSVPAPKPAPVIAPVSAPKPAPVITPVLAPKQAPVITPVFAPKPVPVFSPVPAPKPTPVFSPVSAPKPAPIFSPVPAPVFSPAPASMPVQHYIAESSVSHHVSNLADQQYSSMSSYTSKSESVEMIKSHQENVIEEHQAKASEIIKSWPPGPLPKDDVALKAPQMVKDTVPRIESLMVRPVSVQDITDEVYLEPGPPPEIGFAQAPRERRQSYVEIIEQDLEKNLEREPSRVLPGSVRTIPPPREKSLPPPLPPKKEQLPQAPPLPAKPIKVEPLKKTAEIPSKPFERFPDLEPFPFKPVADKPKSPKPPPPPTPSKFIKGRFGDSDYESDFESIKIQPKWKPCASDNEEPSYKKVKPPKLTPVMRSRSTEPEPLPPSRFDQPPHFQGPPRPAVDFETTKRELKRDVTVKQISKQIRREIKTTPAVQKMPSPPELKPGSPPIYIQAEAPKPKAESPKLKPESPKMKQKVYKESGYMADTDEPFTLTRKSTKMEQHHHKSEEKTEIRHVSQSFESSTQSSQKFMVDTRSTTVPQVPPKVTHKYEHKKHVTSSTASKKVRFQSLCVLLCFRFSWHNYFNYCFYFPTNIFFYLLAACIIEMCCLFTKTVFK